jgi:hypothetical protein
MLMFLTMLLMPCEAQHTAKAEYNSLIERLKSGDANVDFGKLRAAYAASSEYSPPETDPDALEAMYAALSKRKYDEAIRIAEKALKEHYLDIDAHHVLSIAYRGSKDPIRADFHHGVAGGLINAILKSGDGKSPQTAMVVLATHEEYVILSVLALRPGSQSLQEKEGHFYDMLKAVSTETNQTVTLYFNIDKPYGYLDSVIRRGTK